MATATQPRAAADGTDPPDRDQQIAENILARAEALNLDFCVDEVVEKSGNSFQLSILQQLRRRKNLYDSLRPAFQALVDNNDPKGFRLMVADHELREGRSKYGGSHLDGHSWWQRWNVNYLDEETPADDHFIEATARCLKMDIFLTSEESTGENPMIYFGMRSGTFTPDEPKISKADGIENSLSCLWLGN